MIEVGIVPTLQVWGDQDLITPLSDAMAFQADYGGDAELMAGIITAQTAISIVSLPCLLLLVTP